MSMCASATKFTRTDVHILTTIPQKPENVLPRLVQTVVVIPKHI